MIAETAEIIEVCHMPRVLRQVWDVLRFRGRPQNQLVTGGEMGPSGALAQELSPTAGNFPFSGLAKTVRRVRRNGPGLGRVWKRCVFGAVFPTTRASIGMAGG
jgi:hypothetical protein